MRSGQFWTRLAAATLSLMFGYSPSAAAQNGVANVAPAIEASDPLVEKSKFTVDETDPEGHLPSAAQVKASPIQFGYFLMDLSDRADGAVKRGDHRDAVRYYRAIAKAVPDQAVAFSRLCASYEALNDRDNALANCRQALDLEGVTVADFARYVRLVIARPGALDPAELEAAKQAIAHLQNESNAGLAAPHLRCELAVRMRDQNSLAACTAALAKVAPEDPKTISFQWALAVERGRVDEAKALIARAERAHLGPAGVAKMRTAVASLEHEQPSLLRRVFAHWGIILLVGAVLALLLGNAVRRAVRRSRLHTV